MKDSKKLEKLYEAYLRDNLSNMPREEMIEAFISTVLKFMDFNQPQVKQTVVDILMRYEKRKKKEEEESKLEEEGVEEKAELDFSSMYKPSDFKDLVHQLTLYSSSHSQVIDLEDVLNATAVVKSIRRYMFDTEVPWVGIMEEVLCFAWGSEDKKMAVVVFDQGQAQLEFSYKEEVLAVDFEEGTGEVEEECVLKLIREAYDANY